MLAIVNNQQNPTFQQRTKMGGTSQKVVQYLRNKDINPNHLLIGSLVTTGGTAAVSYANPDLIAAPNSAKFGVLGGLAATVGAMFTSTGKKETAEAQNNEEAPLPNANRTTSPLLMTAFGVSLGSGVPAAMSPVVQYNAKRITEQRLEIAQQQEKLAKLKPEVEQVNSDEITLLKEQIETQNKEIEKLKSPFRNSLKYIGTWGPVALTGIDWIAWSAAKSDCYRDQKVEVEDLIFLRSLLSKW